ncbi:hypothetical protein KAJ83_16660 [Marivibrio halodurans]|uniref:Uncharacterized protein n=1 Tax=Marivibrio halodurans TaxID=2039722 RepID=A0A8J7S875_9PROT|nr:hypothetical protein [Marivibrio halodurans]MBP5858654.1 hypothetical protein [Marivibrio halodurans]
MDFDTPPPEIGPHEDRELELMLSGEKPLAYFSELTRADFEWPDEEFEPYVESGRIIKREILHVEIILGVDEEIRSLYFVLPGEEWRIDKAHANRIRVCRTAKDKERDAREMGELLGYTPHEIKVFLRWNAYLDRAIRDGDWVPPRTPQ